MTLPTLISKMSGRVPRFVTVAGQIVAGNQVVSTANGHYHPELGRVTSVRRHTDHGGMPLHEAAGPQWWERDPERLELEAAAMTAAFPGFEPVETRGRPAWWGVLDTGRGHFEITVVHRGDHGLPYVVPSKPSLFRRKEGRRFRWAPHRYSDGNLCVASAEDWDADRDEASTVVGWAADWLATFTTWRITGRGWPCEGVEVDAW